jgi:hypothetical protein
MTLDERLLADVRAARDRYDVLQRQALQQRPAFYEAVRALYAAGASLREIADALDMSHQRVHQIVNGDAPRRDAPTGGIIQRLTTRRAGSRGRDERPSGGRKQPFDRFAVDARIAMSQAQQEAQGLGHAYIGTEHLLLGLLQVPSGLAARLLTGQGMELDGTRQAVEDLVGRGESAATGPMPMTARAKKALELALDEAKDRHSAHVGSEHLLLGLAREGAGIAAHLLGTFGAEYETLRRRVDRAGMACSFCGRLGADVPHLVAGPGVQICDGCTETALQVLGGSEPATGSLLSVTDDSSATCSFCGKGSSSVNRLVAGPAARICGDCLALCSQIQREDVKAD